VTFEYSFVGTNNADLSVRTGWTKTDGNRAAQTTGTNSGKHVTGSTPDSGYVTELLVPKHHVQRNWLSLETSTTFWDLLEND